LLTATQAAARLRDGSATSVELVEHCLARISAREPTACLGFVDRDIALAQARVRDSETPEKSAARRARRHQDIFDTYDMPTAYGRKSIRTTVR
jgi:amidase